MPETPNETEKVTTSTATAPTPAKKPRKLTESQKAAAVMVALGSEKASALYKYMEPEDVEQLTVEIAQLGYLDGEETEEILNSFYQICQTNKAVTEGGLKYARTVLEKAYGEEVAQSLLEKVSKTLKKKEFSFMNNVDVRFLFSALQGERPQTIALILSYLDASKAAGVLAQLDEKKQIQVVENIAKIDSVSPTAIKIIEAEMSKKFSSIVSSNSVKVGGIDYVADVMNNLDRTSEQNIFEGLGNKDHELADEIRKRMFVFEDIVTMDDRSIQRFLRDCDSKDLVLSLKVANEEVSQKLFSNMSGRVAENIRDELEITNNVRMRDVSEAQQRVVEVIRSLEEKGEIIIAKNGQDDIIA